MIGTDMPQVNSNSTTTGLPLSRSQILGVTARCLSEKGYDGTTIRQIAGMLGCAVGSIYRYFRDKRELLDAVTQQNLEPVAVLMDAGGTVEQTMTLYYQRATHDLGAYQLMYWLAAIANPVQQVAPGQSPASLPAMPAIVSRLLQGWTSQLNDTVLAQECWAVLHGAIVQGLDQKTAMASVERVLSRTLATTMTSGTNAAALGSSHNSSNGPEQPAVMAMPLSPVRTALPVTLVSATPPKHTEGPRESEDVVLL